MEWRVCIAPCDKTDLTALVASAGGGGGDVFADLFSVDGAGVRTAVYSGAGPGWALIQFAPTPWVRVALVASQTSVRTVGVFTVAQYT